MDASSDFCWKEKWFHAVGSCGGFDSICKVAAANIPSSLIVAESRLVLTYPAEQLVKKMQASQDLNLNLLNSSQILVYTK